jgi:hypothetical protein
MSELLLPASVAIAAVALTYVFCIRPMRRGHCGMASSTSHGRGLDQELAEVRAELARELAQPGSERAGEVPARGSSRPSSSPPR